MPTEPDLYVTIVDEGGTEVQIVGDQVLDIAGAADGELVVVENGGLGTRTLTDGDVPAGVARDSEVEAAIADAAPHHAEVNLLGVPFSMLNSSVWGRTQYSACFGGGYTNSNGGAINDGATWTVDLAAGTWQVTLLYMTNAASAVITADISFDGGATWTPIGTVDSYAVAFAASAISWTVALDGGHGLLRFRGLSKNGSSTGYYTFLSAASFTRQGA